MLLAGCCVAAIALALASDSTIKGGIAVGAALGLIGLYFLDRRREARAEARALSAADVRLKALLRQRQYPDFKLVVNGSRGLRFAWLALVLGLVFLFNAVVAKPQTGLWVLALGFSIGGLFVILFMWPARNKPVIILSKSGFETPWTGTIPWQAVEGIDLKKIQVRSVKFEILVFLIPSLSAYHPQLSWFMRLIYRSRPSSWEPRFQVRLQEPSEHPDVVFKLARALWTDATGRTANWNSD